MHSLGCLLYDVYTLRCVVSSPPCLRCADSDSNNSVPEAKDFNSVPNRLPNGKLSDYSPDLQRLIQDLLEDQVSLQLNGFSTTLSNNDTASSPAREQPYLRPSAGELLATGYIWTWYRNIRLCVPVYLSCTDSLT
jgi:hypothetical protein